MPEVAEVEPKAWWTSRTIIGAAAVIVSQLVALYGVQIDPSMATEVIAAAVSLVGGVLAIVGRVKASRPIR